jgi:hypothetical protein
VLERDRTRMMVLSAMIVIVLAAVAIPTCQMVGCDMGMNGMLMPFSTHFGPSFDDPCTGSWISNAGQAGIVPSNAFSALVAMLGALFLGALMFFASSASRPLSVVEANAPPPPLDPRGERLLR